MTEEATTPEPSAPPEDERPVPPGRSFSPGEDQAPSPGDEGSSSPGSREASHCARKLAVLADATRLSVMRQLLDGPRRVWELNRQLDLEQSLLSHHLRVLREAELVVSERRGRSVLYRLAPGVRRSPSSEAIDLQCCRLSFE